MSATASQITGISIVYSTICSVLLTQHMGRAQLSSYAAYITSIMSNKTFLIPGADQRKYQSSASLTFERGIHRWPVDPTQKASNAEMYLFDDVMMSLVMIDHLKGQLLFKPCNIGFVITKMTPRILFTEISCKFIFFTLEIVGLVQWNLKMHFAAQLVIYV